MASRDDSSFRSSGVGGQQAIDIGDLPVQFARYHVNLSVAGKAKMLAERRIGVDWGLGPLDVPSDYSHKGRGAKADYNNLQDASRNGALVFAQAESLAPDRAMIGPVHPGTPIERRPYEYISRDRGGDGDSDPAEGVTTLTKAADGESTPDLSEATVDHALMTQQSGTPRVYMKTLQLDLNRTVMVHRDDAPDDLFDMSNKGPRPRGSLRNWKKADAVHALYAERTE